MGWGEVRRSQNDGAGTTGEIEDAHAALDEMGIPAGALAPRVLDLAARLNSD